MILTFTKLLVSAVGLKCGYLAILARLEYWRTTYAINVTLEELLKLKTS